MPTKERGHNLEERTRLCKEQILFYERLATLSFASTFHGKLVNTFMDQRWESLHR